MQGFAGLSWEGFFEGLWKALTGLTSPISDFCLYSCGFLVCPRLCTKSRSFIGFLGVKIGLSGLEKAFKMRLKRSY
jgi:hypothetical protein